VAKSAEEIQKAREAWRATLADIVEKDGFFKEISARHKAIYIPQTGEAGKTLVVVFDNLDDVRQDNERLPWAVDFISSQGWSALGFMAHGPTWYRDENVYDFFDGLRDDGFFDGFDRVVFYGTSMGGYAAATFSAASPGTTVVAINPQATLDREVANWEKRYRPAWKYDYTSRYGYAPDMVKSAERMWLFFDSQGVADSMHASLFQGDNITKVRCPFMGHGMLSVWREIGVLKAVVSGCINATITKPEIHARVAQYTQVSKDGHDPSCQNQPSQAGCALLRCSDGSARCPALCQRGQGGAQDTGLAGQRILIMDGSGAPCCGPQRHGTGAAPVLQAHSAGPDLRADIETDGKNTVLSWANERVIFKNTISAIIEAAILTP
jgi:pimeloyl-ACP methyl ester carboxylesterase